MADVSFTQSSFLGGEWSPFAQGNIVNPKYKTAMNLCRNGYPTITGAWTRRPGFQFCAATRKSAPGRVLQFNFTDLAPYRVELTDGFARLYDGPGLVFTADITNVTSINNATPAVVTLAAPVTWVTGNSVQFLLTNNGDASVAHLLYKRQFTITVIDSTHFSLADSVTGAPVNGLALNWNGASVTAQAARVLELATPFVNSQWKNVRLIAAANPTPQSAAEAILLHSAYKPQVISTTGLLTGGNTQGFAISTQDFTDGPYYDPPTSGATMQPSGTGLSGNINLVVSDPLAIGPNGFTASDVGRHIRLYSEPQPWIVAGNPYVGGAIVKYQNNSAGIYYYTATGGSASTPPPQYGQAGFWVVQAPNLVAAWVWVKVVSVTNNTTVVVAVQPNADGTPSFGFPYWDCNVSGGAGGGNHGGTPATPVQTWRLGVFGGTVGWPAAGCYHEGRLWFTGVVGNRVDGSNVGQLFNMAPTAPDGTVGAANAVTATFDSDNTNTVYFMEPTSYGIICGTKNGEWVVSAPTSGAIAPNNSSAKRATKVGSANVLPASTPLTAIIVHKYQRMMVEYFPEVFSGKMTAPDLNSYARHLSTPNIAEIGYQSELVPLVWARCNDGSIMAATYQRRAAYGVEDPSMAGFHKHTLGDSHSCVSLAVGPDVNGTLDALYLVEFDPSRSLYHVTVSRTIPDESSTLLNGWYVDDGVVPYGAKQATVGGVSGLTLYGLFANNGETVSAQIGGLDCGDYTVANGTIFVPYQSDPGKAFTLTYLQSISASTYGDMAVTIDGTTTTIPAVTGFTYTSQGQLLRPTMPPDVGTQNGPGLGKTRRLHQFGALMTLGVSGTMSIGDNPNTNLFPITFRQADFNTAVPTTQLYSGLHWDTLDSDYNFDGMVYWQVSRPVPCTIAAISGYLHGQDR